MNAVLWESKAGGERQAAAKHGERDGGLVLSNRLVNVVMT